MDGVPQEEDTRVNSTETGALATGQPTQYGTEALTVSDSSA